MYKQIIFKKMKSFLKNKWNMNIPMINQNCSMNVILTWKTQVNEWIYKDLSVQDK
jgi:hypothetical protein